ncbi:phosphoesterase RecJ domain protein [Solidesulfovibrio fructosivorans JJ]]|uniref:Phosphoesterase RecJ domain protein n=1 Tax=Solidesulfovibrio fructosivorans JJ] TaxID=596151 RepID=E1JYM3_SOLFR|nr:DHH family phosphoesterase [Solidesulfovibrio fructosivorans]EFL50607.1 phosphoesterase RecJ domain protein [Solidesulfovibrio fructosivorans JJ]]
MSYFRKLTNEVNRLTQMFGRDDKWLIVINADPDAMGSALALRRIMARRVADVGIARVNEIKRPDNLAMMRFLRIPNVMLTPAVKAQYDHFAMVDSQPTHHPDFKICDFSVIIDHHPVKPEFPVKAAFADIRPDYGATSSIMTEYLYNMRIRPGKLLATALVYGIKTDTQSFERHFIEADVKAFSYLAKCADMQVVRKIISSEYHRHWLKYFSKAFRKMRFVGQRGLFVYMDNLESPDILVMLADFFTRVHGLSWNVLCGVIKKQVVVIFRGDGIGRNMGHVASKVFGDIGSAGGHRGAARAEIELEKLGGKPVEEFLYKRLTGKKLPTKEKCPI